MVVRLNKVEADSEYKSETHFILDWQLGLGASGSDFRVNPLVSIKTNNSSKHNNESNNQKKNYAITAVLQYYN